VNCDVIKLLNVIPLCPVG